MHIPDLIISLRIWRYQGFRDKKVIEEGPTGGIWINRYMVRETVWSMGFSKHDYIIKYPMGQTARWAGIPRQKHVSSYGIIHISIDSSFITMLATPYWPLHEHVPQSSRPGFCYTPQTAFSLAQGRFSIPTAGTICLVRTQMALLVERAPWSLTVR